MRYLLLIFQTSSSSDPILIPALSFSYEIPTNCYMLYSLHKKPDEEPQKVPVTTRKYLKNNTKNVGLKHHNRIEIVPWFHFNHYYRLTSNSNILVKINYVYLAKEKNFLINSSFFFTNNYILFLKWKKVLKFFVIWLKFIEYIFLS